MTERFSLLAFVHSFLINLLYSPCIPPPPHNSPPAVWIVPATVIHLSAFHWALTAAISVTATVVIHKSRGWSRGEEQTVRNWADATKFHSVNHLLGADDLKLRVNKRLKYINSESVTFCQFVKGIMNGYTITFVCLWPMGCTYSTFFILYMNLLLRVYISSVVTIASAYTVDTYCLGKHDLTSFTFPNPAAYNVVTTWNTV